MQTTTNIGLKTYEANDPTDWLGEFNYNMNKIDTAVGSQNDQIDVIEATANTASTTANTASTTATNASTTATQALDVANSKPSINDTVAGATSTYSSNKIEELISGAGGTEIDDTTTSTTKTWSSSKINTEISALTQKYSPVIQNPDITKYNSWSCRCGYSGNILYISGSFSFNQAPSSQYLDVLTLPSNIKFYDVGSSYPYIATGYITKAGDPSYLKNDVIFQAVNRKIRLLFPNNFDYSQIDSSYHFDFSFTLISDNL